jgi:hypothetical protein
MHRRKVDEREEFVNETVDISFGPKATVVPVNLKWPKSAEIVNEYDDLDNIVARRRVWSNGMFVFAVYGENPQWHKTSRDEWEAAAGNALEKFCAMRKVSIKAGPKQEMMNRYNIMVETNEPMKEG